MKATKLLIAAALLGGGSLLALAGPGPQSWDQQSKNQLAQKATAVTPQPGPVTKICASCSCESMCK
jgi:hypothetical protein